MRFSFNLAAPALAVAAITAWAYDWPWWLVALYAVGAISQIELRRNPKESA